MRLHLHRLVVLTSILGLAACGGKSADDGGGAEPGATEATPGIDVAALTGTWKGDYGELTFNADGTGTFTVQNCGFGVLGPGRYEAPKDISKCETKEYSGQVIVKGYEIGIGDPKGRVDKFEGYFDAAGALHFGMSVRKGVGAIKAGVGKVTVNMFDELAIKDGACTISAKRGPDQTPKPVPCRFEADGDIKVFIYTEGDSDEGLVHLEKEGLLVPPKLVLTAYTKAP